MKHPEKRKGNWIGTYSGMRFWPIDPRVEEIKIEDIAHALSLMCRWTGHCKGFYSVAQHSVLVSAVCPRDYRVHGLLHDAAEAYLCDLSRPIKNLTQMTPYRKAERTIAGMVCKAFGIKPPLITPAVREADNRVMVTEIRDLFDNRFLDEKYLKPEDSPKQLDSVIVPWSPAWAEVEFLERFYRLVKRS